MFDLNQSITEWRKRMAAGGIKTPAILDELESHLREDVELQTRAGSDVEKAFTAAVQKIGSASALKREFKKSTAVNLVEKMMVAIAAVFVAFGIFLTTVTLILCYGSFAERFAGFTALAFLLLAGFGWPYVAPFLPVILRKRDRWAAQVGCLLGGFGLATFYVQVIVHPFQTRGDGILPAIGFWAAFPVAIGFALACALERAVQRAQEQIPA
jgi:hypothetical protein